MARDDLHGDHQQLAFFGFWWQPCPPPPHKAEAQRETEDEESRGHLALWGAGSFPSNGGQVLSRLPGSSCPVEAIQLLSVAPENLPSPQKIYFNVAPPPLCHSLKGHKKAIFVLKAQWYVVAATFLHSRFKCNRKSSA